MVSLQFIFFVFFWTLGSTTRKESTILEPGVHYIFRFSTGNLTTRTTIPYCRICQRGKTFLFLIFWLCRTTEASALTFLPVRPRPDPQFYIQLVYQATLSFKVRIFWEGHKIWKNLPFRIRRYSLTSNFMWKIFSNFVAFSEYPNFTLKYENLSGNLSLIFFFKFWRKKKIFLTFILSNFLVRMIQY